MPTPEDPVVANRRARLREWIDTRFGGSQTLFMASTNDGIKQLNQGELSGLLRTKTFGERRARSLEAIAGMPTRYLDDMTSPYAPSTPQMVRDLGPNDDATGQTAAQRALPPLGWPFSSVSLKRIVQLKKSLSPKMRVSAMSDIDETLELVVQKWERRAASQTKSVA